MCKSLPSLTFEPLEASELRFPARSRFRLSMQFYGFFPYKRKIKRKFRGDVTYGKSEGRN